MLDAADLLVGPRGRRVCLELAVALSREAAPLTVEELPRAVRLAAHRLDPGRGVSRRMLRRSGRGPRAAEPLGTPEEVAALVSALPITRIDDRLLMGGLAMAVDFARYWQEPEGEDVLAAVESVQCSLVRVAESVASSAAAQWWATTLEHAGQWRVAFDDERSPTSSKSGAAADHLARWQVEAVEREGRARRDRPSDPRARVSGEWWSTPPRELTRTTRRLGAAGPLGLRLVEDAFDWDRAVVHRVEAPDDAAVYEIDGPQAWAQLCDRFPLEVTASRRHDWFRTTGATGSWVIPDWSRAAEEYDAIHLTVAGYLKTAGRAVAVTDDTASVLAGWDPDQTYWLTDVTRPSGPAHVWIRHEDTWTEQPG